MNKSSTTEWFREYRLSIGISLILVTISYFLQLEWCQSALQQSNQVWIDRLDYHLTSYPFSIRYLTSYSTILISKIFSLPIRDSFLLLHFLLLTALGPVFFCYLRKLNLSNTMSNWGVFLLYICYPIMAAQIQPIHTWDDMWVYVFLALTFTFLVSSKPFKSALFFTLAIFAREQTLAFYPLFLYGIWLFSGKRFDLKKCIYALLPLLIYAPFYIYVFQDPAPDRWRCIIFNFENPLRISDTLFSFLVSFGFIWIASLMGLFKTSGADKHSIEKFISYCAVFAVPVTIIFALFFTCARETRIFFPPFIFLIPLALIYLKSLAGSIRGSFTGSKIIIPITAFVLFIALGIVLGKIIFPEFEYRACSENAQLWIGAHIGFGLCLILFEIVIRRRQSKSFRSH